MIAVSRTNRGLVRHNNEDSVLVREPDLFAIADGMGGADAGEVASYEAVHLLESLDLSQVDRTNILSSLETAIIRINKKIFDLASEKSTFRYGDYLDGPLPAEPGNGLCGPCRRQPNLSLWRGTAPAGHERPQLCGRTPAP